MSAPPVAIIARRFAAPIEAVFEACTKPDLIARWMSPRPFEVCTVEADVRVGGRFSYRMSGGPGDFAAEGVYREVVPPVRLVLTWEWTDGPPEEPPDGVISLVTFDLAPDGDGTMLTLTHEGLPNAERADSHRQGWTETFEKLAGLLSERNTA